MADIRSYTREKQKRERNKQSNMRLLKSESEDSFREKLRKHRLSYFYKIALCVLVCVALIAILVIRYRNKIYTDYMEVNSVALELSARATEVRLGQSVLTYSKDGVRCIDEKGEVIWNQTYEMQNPIVVICEDVSAIGDYNGRTIYVHNQEKQLGVISTNLPIRDISVAANGVVAAVLEETDVTWIYVYDSAGKELLKFRTTMKNTGYPVAVSLSKDALLCAVSYLYVDAGSLKSTVAFYNFDEYGKNQIDNLVGIHNYPDVVVPHVQFMDDNVVFAVADDGIMFFGGSQKPEFKSVHYFDKEIKSVYHNEKYVGVVLYNELGGSRYCIHIFDKSGERVATQEFNMEYTDVLFDKETFMIYSDKECLIYTLDGLEKFAGSFKETVQLVVPTKGDYRYKLVTQDSLNTIQMN